jgi:hypothetical protein
MTRQLRVAIVTALLALSPCMAGAASASGSTEEEKKAAQKMFEAGDGLYESGRFDDAIAAFKNSHDLVASPNSRLMLARSLREAGRNNDACEEFRGTIHDAEASGGRYPEALQAAQSELKALENMLAEIEFAPALREQILDLQVNGKPVTLTAAPVPVVAGTVSVSYRLKDGTNLTKTVEVAQGTRRMLEAEAPTNAQSAPADRAAPKAAVTSGEAPPTPTSNPLRTAAWVSAGVGVLGLSAFGVFGYLDRKTFRDLDAACSNARCSADSMERLDRGRRYQLFANVGLGVAAVGAAAAATLFVLSPRKEPEGTRIAVQASATGLLIDGRF